MSDISKYKPALLDYNLNEDYFNKIIVEEDRSISEKTFEKIYSILCDQTALKIHCYNMIKNLQFSEWFKMMFILVTQSRQLKMNKAINEILQIYDDIYNMKRFRILLNAPPRTGKSTIAQYFMLFSMIHEPRSKFIYLTYSDKAAKDRALEFKNLTNSIAFKIGYRNNNLLNDGSLLNYRITNEIDNLMSIGDGKKTKDIVTNTKFLFANGGEIQFLSVNGSVTGNGAGIKGITDHFTGCVIFDDPNKPETIHSEVMQEKITYALDNTVRSRVENKDKTAILIMQQRTYENDLTGYILKRMANHDYEEYDYSIIPLITLDNMCTLNYTNKEMYAIYLNNKSVFMSQYQQIPQYTMDRLIDISLFKYYTNDVRDLNCAEWFITTDYSSDNDENSDFNCIILWGLKYNLKEETIDLYLVDMLYGKFPKRDKITLTNDFYHKWKGYRTKYVKGIEISFVAIEKNGNGQSFLEECRKYFDVKKFERSISSSKILRANSFIQYFGKTVNIYLPRNHEVEQKNIDILLYQCKDFTGGKKKHDDIVDNILDAGAIAADKYSEVRKTL